MKKLFKLLKWLSIFILVLCGGLWVTGHGYMLKAITMTYFVGQSGPGIDEKESFYNDTIEASYHPQEWLEHDKLGTLSLSENAENKLNEIRSVSFLVFKNQELLFEKYWGDFDQSHPTNSFSASKSIVSLLIGIAIDQGKIASLDDLVGKYLTSFTRGEKSKITLRHLLTMSAGLDWEESGANPFSDAAEAYYGSGLEELIDGMESIKEPGKTFEYSSGNTQVLAFVLEEATGTPIAEYAEKNLWQKIGATHDAYWNLNDENGRAKAFCCYYATPRDYARIGQLYLNKGTWHGSRVISESYLNACTTPADIEWNNAPNKKYGLHWWITTYNDQPVHYAVGMFGQYIITLPQEQLVIVRTGWEKKPSDAAGHPADLYEHIEAAFELIEKTNA